MAAFCFKRSLRVADPKSPPKKSIFSNLEIGPTEILFLSGLVLLFIGLGLWFGIGVALAACGAVLVVTAVLSAVITEIGARHAV
jgi:hypothetical protein